MGPSPAEAENALGARAGWDGDSGEVVPRPRRIGAGSRALRQIGQRIFFAAKTVKNHISRLPAKLGVERRTRGAVIATQAEDRLKQQGH